MQKEIKQKHLKVNLFTRKKSSRVDTINLNESIEDKEKEIPLKT